MATDSRLTSTGRLKDRYGNRSSVLGVGRSDKNVSFISGTYHPASDAAPTYPVWADGRKVVQVMIWREPDVTVNDSTLATLTGSLDRSAASTSTQRIDLIAQAGRYLKQATLTYISGPVTPSGNVSLISEKPDELFFNWYANGAKSNALHQGNNTTTYLFTPTGFPNNILLEHTFKQWFTDHNPGEFWFDAISTAVVSNNDRYVGFRVLGGSNASYELQFAAAPVLNTELNEVVATVSADHTSLNGSVPMRGGDVLTMGFTASEMPTITEGAALFGVSIGQELDPEFGYCFVIK